MKILTPNQKAVLAAIEGAESPLTVAELSEQTGVLRTSVRRALVVIEKHTDVEQVGEAFSGGKTWGFRP